MVTRIIAREWDAESNRLFEQSLKHPNEIPELGEVMQFMHTRFQSLEAIGSRNFYQIEDVISRPRWRNTSTISCC